MASHKAEKAARFVLVLHRWYCRGSDPRRHPHRNEVFTMFVFFWLSHCDPPKILIVKAKMHALSGCSQTLSDIFSNFSGKDYLSAALTIKILGRERLFRQKKPNLPGRKDGEDM